MSVTEQWECSVFEHREEKDRTTQRSAVKASFLCVFPLIDICSSHSLSPPLRFSARLVSDVCDASLCHRSFPSKHVSFLLLSISLLEFGFPLSVVLCQNLITTPPAPSSTIGRFGFWHLIPLAGAIWHTVLEALPGRQQRQLKWFEKSH